MRPAEPIAVLISFVFKRDDEIERAARYQAFAGGDDVGLCSLRGPDGTLRHY